MRVAYLFFISLCFLLLGAHSYAVAGTHQKRMVSSAIRDAQKAQKVILSNSGQEHPVLTTASSTEDNEHFISVEDDENNVFARKYVLPANSFIIISFTFIFGYLKSCEKKRLPFSRHLSYTSSYRYLVQRSIRI